MADNDPQLTNIEGLRWFHRRYPDFRKEWATARDLSSMIDLLAAGRHARAVNPEYDGCVRRTICWCAEQAVHPTSPAAMLRDYFAIVWLFTRGFMDKDTLEGHRIRFLGGARGAAHPA